MFIDFEPNQRNTIKHTQRRMSDTNDLMDFIWIGGTGAGDVHRRTPQCVGKGSSSGTPHGGGPDVGLFASGTIERGRNRLMRWQRGERSGHDLARESGMSEQRDYRLEEMPLAVQPVQPLIGAKRSRDGLGPSHSADSPTAATPRKKVRTNQSQIQTVETSETLEKKDKHWKQLCTRLKELQEKAKNCDEWKRKYEELQILSKEEEINHLKELYNASVSKLSPEVLAMMNTETTAKSKTQELYRPSEVTAPQRLSSP